MDKEAYLVATRLADAFTKLFPYGISKATKIKQGYKRLVVEKAAGEDQRKKTEQEH